MYVCMYVCMNNECMYTYTVVLYVGSIARDPDMSDLSCNILLKGQSTKPVFQETQTLSADRHCQVPENIDEVRLASSCSSALL